MLKGGFSGQKEYWIHDKIHDDVQKRTNIWILVYLWKRTIEDHIESLFVDEMLVYVGSISFFPSNRRFKLNYGNCSKQTKNSYTSGQFSIYLGHRSSLVSHLVCVNMGHNMNGSPIFQWFHGHLAVSTISKPHTGNPHVSSIFSRQIHILRNESPAFFHAKNHHIFHLQLLTAPPCSLPPSCIRRSCWLLQWSMLVERTKDRWTPRPRWRPAMRRGRGGNQALDPFVEVEMTCKKIT